MANLIIFWMVTICIFVEVTHGMDLDTIYFHKNLAGTICKVQREYGTSGSLQAEPLKEFKGINGTKIPENDIIRKPCEGKCNPFSLVKPAQPLSIMPIEERKQKSRESSSGGSRIAVGKETTPHSIPYMVTIQELINNTFTHIAAAIMNKRDVVVTTAQLATMIDEQGHRKFRLVAGVHSLSAVTDTSHRIQIRSIGNVVIHPLYEPTTLKFDIARIHVRPSFRFNKKIKGNKFANQEEANHLFESHGALLHCQIYGWGWQTAAGPNSDVLRNIPVPIVHPSVCRSFYPTLDLTFPTELCFGIDGFSPCFNDEGGPVVCWANHTQSWKTFGMVSYVAACGAFGEPSIVRNTFDDDTRKFIFKQPPY